LESGLDASAGRKILKLERNTVVWIGQCRDNDDAVVFKMYRNRGGISWQREKLFRLRVEREYRALSFLDRHGIHCSTPLFWTYGCDQTHGRYEILCMRVIPGAITLEQLAMAGRGGEIDFPALYSLVRQMHAAGFYHACLHLGNIVVGADEFGTPRTYVIDTPQSMMFPRDIAGTSMAWLDLRAISANAMLHMTAETCRSLLLRYGLDERAAARMMSELKRPAKPLLSRNLLRFVFGLRSRLAFSACAARSAMQGLKRAGRSSG
jgi:hypothetical protein